MRRISWKRCLTSLPKDCSEITTPWWSLTWVSSTQRTVFLDLGGMQRTQIPRETHLTGLQGEATLNLRTEGSCIKPVGNFSMICTRMVSDKIDQASRKMALSRSFAEGDA
jgi:hypothetical protein